MELKTHGIGGEGLARQPRPFDRTFSFLDPLLARATPVIEGDNTLGRPRQVGDDEADAGVQLARMPFDLRHNMARLVPALRLIAKAGVITRDLVRWSPDRPLGGSADLV